MTSRNLFLCLGALLVWAACSSEILKPTANAGPDQPTVNVGAVVQLDGTGSTDPQGLTLTYSWTTVDAPAGSKAALLGPNTDKPSFVPDLPGSWTFALVVSNGVAASDPARVNITTNGSCGANKPVIESIAQTPMAANIGAVVSLSATVHHADEMTPCAGPDGKPIKRNESYAWTLTSTPSGSSATLQDANTPTPWLTPDVVGDYLVTLVVTDDLGHASDPKTYKVIAGECGKNPPAVTITPSTPSPAVGQTVQLNTMVSDMDGKCMPMVVETFSYAWQITSLPSGSKAALNSAAAANPSFTPDVPGEYDFSLVVTDSGGVSSPPTSAKVTANKCGSNPPVIAGILRNPQQPNAYDLVTLSATVTDADQNAMVCQPPFVPPTLFYDWSIVSAPAGSKAKLNNPALQSPSFTPDQSGTYTIQLVVTDTEGHTAVDQLAFGTTACGAQAPVAQIEEVFPNTIGPPQTADFSFCSANGGNNIPVQLSGALSSSPDNQGNCNLGKTLTYRWQFLAMPKGVNAGFNSPFIVNPWFVVRDCNNNFFQGDYVIGLTVTDNDGLTSQEAQFTIHAQ